ncbi:tRNA1(Val) (adenine(37)-N6)-methyltransferase [Roseovarius salinarum]|uniref:tRNA1(Val) (adenine(37)-N6)-methyltransferase n=1 Tax=Roseovarius salinarum TaxID=1981892 RepID=UPI000C32EE07|nr:methyltransferase [Roseovarius salinarum]
MSDDAPGAGLTRDAFLGGRLQILQPRGGYRAGVDPVLLAASVPARAGQSVLDLGCGTGVAALCLGARVPGLDLSGLELQPEYAELARRNAADNGIPLQVHEGDLRAMPAALRARQFDHVIANPPYFDRSCGSPSHDTGRDTALGGSTPMADWMAAAARRTAPKGYVTMIQRAERLPELLSAAQETLGSLQALPLVPRRGRAARLVLLRGRRGGRAAFRLHDGWVLHRGAAHESDGDDYTRAAARVLRLGKALPFPV